MATFAREQRQSATDMSFAFTEVGFNVVETITLDLSSWNTRKVTDFRYMFSNCKKLERLDIRNFDFSSIDSNGDYCMFSGLNTACLIIVKNETVKTWMYKRLSAVYTVKTVDELTEEEM